MALRSRSRSYTSPATSGPGRNPASDGRAGHRRSPNRYRARHRPPPAEELRRRAELLFGEHAVRRRESGSGPPGRQPCAAPATATITGPTAGTPTPTTTGSAPGMRPARTAPAARPPVVTPARTAPVDDGGVGDIPGPDAGHEPVEPDWRSRAGLALRERLPMWLQVRCGLERRGVAALAVLLVAAAVFAAQHFWTGRTQSVSAPQVVRAESPYRKEGQSDGTGQREEGGKGGRTGPGVSGGAAAPGTAGAEIVVDVGGKVREPGVHRLPAGSRVADALRAAGGVRPGTSTEGLNRARFLVDGEQVVVGGPAPAAGPGAGGSGGPGSAGAAVGAAGPPAPVSLNTATTDQLDTLPGVGPVLAQHIVDYRTQHGGFRSVDELRQVNGIGARRFADLRNLVRP
ncbi:helix-hairpin-helix domain-containing protein [Streptomyces sp. NPDC058964]|uniref:helix-hairpin-helix domain-containing protein n=1 Tax=Streptomyces sp. NPDC058964 TaxID=3346681 RepID=UPI0036A01A53